jgi:hypothetical protein
MAVFVEKDDLDAPSIAESFSVGVTDPTTKEDEGVFAGKGLSEPAPWVRSPT